MCQINIQLWLVCEPVINCDHVLTLSKRLKVLISTLLSSTIIHHFIQLIPCGLNGQVSHSSLEKAVLHLLQVSAGGRRQSCRCHWPVHALAPQLVWPDNHAGLIFWMRGGAEKHHERWRGFVKDWQNSISGVQSGSEKLDRAWQKAYIKIWRLQKRNMYLLRISVGTLFAEPDLKLLLEITIAKFVLYILHCLFRKCTISWFGNEFLIIIAEKISASYL